MLFCLSTVVACICLCCNFKKNIYHKKKIRNRVFNVCYKVKIRRQIWFLKKHLLEFYRYNYIFCRICFLLFSSLWYKVKTRPKKTWAKPTSRGTIHVFVGKARGESTAGLSQAWIDGPMPSRNRTAPTIGIKLLSSTPRKGDICWSQNNLLNPILDPTL